MFHDFGYYLVKYVVKHRKGIFFISDRIGNDKKIKEKRMLVLFSSINITFDNKQYIKILCVYNMTNIENVL